MFKIFQSETSTYYLGELLGFMTDSLLCILPKLLFPHWTNTNQRETQTFPSKNTVRYN